MKKLLYALPLLALLAMTLHSCKKDPDDVSQVVTTSYPTISFSGLPFYSINVGGAVPQISATAYDSILGESYPVEIVGTDAIDNTTPGLYIIRAQSTNRLGFITNENVVVAVTDIADNIDISGNYKRVDVGTGDVAQVIKLARGLYQTDNIAGANRAARPDLLFPVLMVHVDDSTLLLPPQGTPLGTLEVTDANDIPDQVSLSLIVGDSTYSYAIQEPSLYFGQALRTFKKQ